MKLWPLAFRSSSIISVDFGLSILFVLIHRINITIFTIWTNTLYTLANVSTNLT